MSASSLLLCVAACSDLGQPRVTPTSAPSESLVPTKTARSSREPGDVVNSPPRGVLAFAAGGSIYTVNADGSGLMKLVEGPRDPDPHAPARSAMGTTWASAPEFSPDGSQVAFVKDLDVWLVNSDGSDEHRLADVANYEPSPGASNWTPGAGNVSWSPDGSQIAYTLQRAGGSGLSGLGVIEVATGTVTRRLHAEPADGGLFMTVTWLDDGLLAFSWGIEVALLDPVTDTELASVRLSQPASPGSVARDSHGNWLAGPFINEGPIAYGPPGAMQQIASGVSPVFSPDGDWVAYLQEESLRLVRVDGQDDHELVNLEALGGRDRHFAAQPDCFPDDMPGCSYRPPIVSWALGETQTYSDPFEYCDALGTIDKPDGRYVGPPNTREMVLGFARAANVPETSSLWSGSNPGPALVWRCADGALVVCSYGANIPCDEKADTSAEPRQAIIDWCSDPPPGPQRGPRFDVPAVVTGRNTIYLGAWECIDGKPEITGVPLEVDAQGYIERWWYSLTR